MSLSAIIFQSAEKKDTGKPIGKKKKSISLSGSGKFKSLYSLLTLLPILVFLGLAVKIVKAEPISSPVSGQVLIFEKLLPPPKPYPVNKEIYLSPEITAKSVIIMDVDSAVVLYQKNADLRLLPASTTKMMAAMVVLDNYLLSDVLTVGNTRVDGNTIKLIPGEQLGVENLLYGMLIGSGNDAAEVLAEHFPGGVSAFVEAMNQKATDFMLENTHFTNPMGLDGEDHYSTARDLAKLAMKVEANPVLAKIVSTPEVVITDVSGEIKHPLKNTNELIGKVEGAKGVKTGWTENAGECLVAWVEKEGKKVVFVVLESENRFEETQSLVDWAFNNFEWKIIVPTNYL